MVWGPQGRKATGTFNTDPQLQQKPTESLGIIVQLVPSCFLFTRSEPVHTVFQFCILTFMLHVLHLSVRYKASGSLVAPRCFSGYPSHDVPFPRRRGIMIQGHLQVLVLRIPSAQHSMQDMQQDMARSYLAFCLCVSWDSTVLIRLTLKQAVTIEAWQGNTQHGR